ncbi:MAG: hypothetical protein AABW58_03170 [Nanoarchaeota archaeon]
MTIKEIKRDLFYLFCSSLFFFAFFFMNNDVQASKENINLTAVDEPPERCLPKYEDRVFVNEDGYSVTRCVKIGIPDNVYYDKPCEELGLRNPDDYPEKCILE